MIPKFLDTGFKADPAEPEYHCICSKGASGSQELSGNLTCVHFMLGFMKLPT